jgi:hypothetical protein
MKKTLIIVFLLAFAILISLYLIGSTVGDDGQTDERAAIKLCWEKQSKKSFDPATARFAAQVCEYMEDEYKKKWRMKP